MKKVLLLALAILPGLGFSQSFKLLSTDASGDDYPGRMDATELSYTLSSGSDSLYVKITHANVRLADFGFMLALDTNLNLNDGQAINQTNMVGSPNNSMKYDILLYAYQNGMFPGVYTEAYDHSGAPTPLIFELDTVDAHYSIFRIPLTELDGKIDFNLIGFTGGFDISGSGPSDAVPNTTFAEIRESHVGTKEFSLSTSIYPNPASDYFQMEYKGAVRLYNLNGTLVKELQVQPGEKIDCSTLKPSLYIIVLSDGSLAGKLLIN